MSVHVRLSAPRGELFRISSGDVLFNFNVLDNGTLVLERNPLLWSNKPDGGLEVNSEASDIGRFRIGQ